MRACFHVGVMNSKAMEILGLDKESVKKYGAYAETYEDGTPNGVVKEYVFDDIKKTLADVGLEGVENINYLQAIKRVIGMSRKPLANE